LQFIVGFVSVWYNTHKEQVNGEQGVNDQKSNQPADYVELYARAKSAYASPGHEPVRQLSQPVTSHQQPALQEKKNPGLIKRIVRHFLVLSALVLATIGVLYWPTIYRAADYWWRHLRTTERPGAPTNALYPGEKAIFELDDDEPLVGPIVPPDDRIVIDKIEVNAPIVYMDSTADDAVLRFIERGVGHYPQTAKPDEPGNVFLTAHSSYWWWSAGEYKFVFQHLESLVIGDIITVYYQQQRYDYRVRSMNVIKPKGEDADHVFDQEPYFEDPVLTIMTCVPVGTSLRRLIVVAEQISPDPGFATTTTDVSE